MTIKEIEALEVKDMEKMRMLGEAELINIKNHDCYLLDIDNNFGYSILVFKNNRHIYHVNDYQLHYSTKTIEELKEYYIKELNNKLFTEDELMQEIKSYDEYKRKDYYLRNYWIMQYEYISMFYIGKPDARQEKAKDEMFSCFPCFCYVKDKAIVEKVKKFITHIEDSFLKVKENNDEFKKMISYELWNHEACISRDYQDSLNSLGLVFEELTDDQKVIVEEELKKQVYA